MVCVLYVKLRKTMRRNKKNCFFHESLLQRVRAMKTEFKFPN